MVNFQLKPTHDDCFCSFGRSSPSPTQVRILRATPPCTKLAAVNQRQRHTSIKAVVASLPGFEFTRRPLRSRSTTFVSNKKTLPPSIWWTRAGRVRTCPAHFCEGERKWYLLWFSECKKKRENRIRERKNRQRNKIHSQYDSLRYTWDFLSSVVFLFPDFVRNENKRISNII